MNASLPPSSNTTFFKCFPASIATLAPASSLPVKETPFILLSETNADARLPEMNRFVYNPLGASASSKSSSMAVAHCGTLEACLSKIVLPTIILGAANRTT